MGRIVSQVKVSSAAEPALSIQFSGLIDTGAAYVTLPTAWKDRLGKLEVLDDARAELANQTTVDCQIRVGSTTRGAG